MNKTESNVTTSEDLFAPAAGPRRLAAIAIGLAIAAGIAWIAGLFDPMMDYLSPERAEVTGTVTYNGEPLRRGLVMTKCEIPGRMGGLGGIETDGTFKLTTNGDPGIYSGNHRIWVSCMTTTFPPVSILPDVYTQPQTTPFQVTVKRGRLNRIELALKGEPLVEKVPPKGAAEPVREPDPASEAK
jgi:hypothetical protein